MITVIAEVQREPELQCLKNIDGIFCGTGHFIYIPDWPVDIGQNPRKIYVPPTFVSITIDDRLLQLRFAQELIG